MVLNWFNGIEVFLLDTGNELFIWVGSKASIDEKRTSLEKGHNYLKQTSHPMAAISIFCEGDEPQDFKDAFVDFGSK
ncbi:Villin-3 [Exaiptasia diaphana]|nr:Villin-3 [Exaiptasia diaphana]